jgi:hypothetical protein
MQDNITTNSVINPTKYSYSWQIFTLFYHAPPNVSTLSWWGVAGLNDLTGYAGGNCMFPVGLPKPDTP